MCVRGGCWREIHTHIRLTLAVVQEKCFWSEKVAVCNLKGPPRLNLSPTFRSPRDSCVPPLGRVLFPFSKEALEGWLRHLGRRRERGREDVMYVPLVSYFLVFALLSLVIHFQSCRVFPSRCCYSFSIKVFYRGLPMTFRHIWGGNISSSVSPSICCCCTFSPPSSHLFIFSVSFTFTPSIFHREVLKSGWNILYSPFSSNFQHFYSSPPLALVLQFIIILPVFN